MNEAQRNDFQATLLQVCDELHKAVMLAAAQDGMRRAAPGQIDLAILKECGIEVRMHKESSKHSLPHIHVKHSDEISASISIDDFTVLAGKIDPKVRRDLEKRLMPKRARLLEIWNELNHNDNPIEAHRLVKSLFSGRSR